MANPPPLHDPIRTKFYRPLERAESLGDFLFYAGAAASLGPLVLDRQLYPGTYDVLLALFVVFALAAFINGLAIRLYLFPRAEDERRKDFVSNAFGLSLTTERTIGYYNNDQTDPLLRAGLATMESAYFSREVLRLMLRGWRIRVGLYLLIWLAALLYRGAPPDWIATAAQVLFSENILAAWARMEWLHNRHERIYDGLYQLFKAKPKQDRLRAMAMNAAMSYDAGKWGAGVVLSEKVFSGHRQALTANWETIRADLLK